jgi:hypothetical protein
MRNIMLLLYYDVTMLYDKFHGFTLTMISSGPGSGIGAAESLFSTVLGACM